MKACYLLELQATQREPRNWVTSTHGGSGTVILNVIFTEATREFLWVTAKNQYAGRWRREVGGRGTRSTSFFFVLFTWSFTLSSNVFFSSSFKSETHSFEHFRSVTCFSCRASEYIPPPAEVCLVQKANKSYFFSDIVMLSCYFFFLFFTQTFREYYMLDFHAFFVLFCVLFFCGRWVIPAQDIS